MPALTSIEADWSLTTRVLQPRCTVTDYTVTVLGEVCQEHITCFFSCSKRTNPQPKLSNTKGFPGGVPVNTERSASENLRVRR